jgi:CheY-like chemotaxis protein
MRLLLVEDDADLGEAVRGNLRRSGFAVDLVVDLEDAETALHMTTYALMLLDLSLPDGDGRALLRAAFVLMQTPPRGFRAREAEIGLSVLGQVAPVGVVSRSSFQDAQGAGLGVVEFEPESKAAAEVRDIWA